MVTLLPLIDYEELNGEQPFVWGICYKINHEKIKETLEYLDFREKGGYTKEFVNIYSSTDSDTPYLKDVLLYTANKDNPNFLGPSSLKDMALQILSSFGPSGKNSDYLLNLYYSLKSNNIVDKHVEELALNVLDLIKENPNI